MTEDKKLFTITIDANTDSYDFDVVIHTEQPVKHPRNN